MLNNCTFQGRFAADPEMRTTQSGLTVASFRMAVDRDNVGQDGRRATSSRPIRISSHSRWASTPRASGSSGSRVPPAGSSPATRRAIPMTFLRLMTRTTCRSDRNKEVVGW